MKINFFYKLGLIAFVLGLTYGYALYEKSKLYGNGDAKFTEPVLRELPLFTINAITTGETLTSKKFLEGNKAIFVHIWGTWCAPCEKEMPEFLAYAKKLEQAGVKFLLVAVNDDEVKIKKFLIRFPEIPKNVTFAIDKENRVMDLLGTLKVPETFLFNSSGKHVNKFIGPQDWLAESYVTRLSFWLNNENTEDRKIETH